MFCGNSKKKPEIFNNKHNNNPNEFYFDVLHHLAKNITFNDNSEYSIYLARREKLQLKSFTDSIEKSISKISLTDLSYKCNIIETKYSPENCVVDYLLWAVQRYVLKKEERFFIAMENKYNFILDLYDEKANCNLYNRENPFRIQKIAEIK